ncbi:MAG: Endoglucanase [Verrucomicrobiales bacterium]|nr:Endoglucanase [Verrucomicrobiales bacterium]
MKTGIFKVIYLLAATLGAGTAFGNTNEFRGYWADVFHAGFLNSNQVTTLVDTMRSANCNAIVAEVRARANAYYNGSPYEPKGPGISPSNFDPLADLLAKGHDTSNGKQRLEIHAWLVTYKTSSNQPSAWMHKSRDGTISSGEYDPGHPQVQQRIFNVAMDVVSRYDIDGLNFDYVRYPENTLVGPTLWGYNDVTVARFNARFGRTGLPDVNDPVWNQFRRDQVTALVRKIYLNVMAIKPWVKLSADTITWNPSPTSIVEWTNSARAYNDVLQDWRGWMEEGILDYSIPMDYYRHGAFNYAQDYINWMNFAKDHHYNRHTVIGPGVYMNFATNVITQMRLTREPSTNGNYAQGVCGYSYSEPVTNSSVTSAQVFQALSQPSAYDTNPVPIFAERATIPVMPWKVAPTTGHLKGFVSGGSATNYLDGASLVISGATNRDFISDATGFFGSVDLPPGTYSLTASFSGHGTVTTNFIVTAGLVTTRDLILPINAPPTIIIHPLSQSVTEGTNVTFSVTANGTQPFTYLWKRNGTNWTSATQSSFTISNVTSNDAATFSVIVTNQFGWVESNPAILTVNPPPVVTGTTVIWTVNQTNRPYFTTNHAERGLAYNWATSNLLFIGRSPTTNIYVLNGDTGAELRTLTLTTNVTGGTYPVMMLGVADDGAVYAANLTINNSKPFRLYRWSNDSTSSIPTVAFSDDPGLGNNQRWGDTLDVRGSGTNTQVLLGSRLGNLVSILTTTNGTDFTAKPITVTAVPNGMFGLGIAFGRSNTFWGKTTNNPLYQVSFNLTNGTGTVLKTIADPAMPNTLVPIGVSAGLDLLAGVHWDTPDNLKLYDLSGAGPPLLLAAVNFPTDVANTFFVGSVDFGRDRVFALNGNNGIMALRLQFAPAVAPRITKLEIVRSNRTGLWLNAHRRPYIVESSPDLSLWNTVTNDVPQNGYIEFNSPDSNTNRFYRLFVP